MNLPLDQILPFFDHVYYANRYPDLKDAFGYDRGQLLNHFVNHGYGEGRECFDPQNVGIQVDRRELLGFRPTLASVEVTGRCNIRCVYCAVSQPAYAGGDMPLPILDAVVEKLIQYRYHVCLNGHGETTVVPNWESYAKRLLDAGIDVKISSNLARPLRESEIEVFQKMSSITVSLDTNDRGLLLRTRRGTRLEVVLENIRKIRSGQKRPEIAFSVVVHDQNWKGLYQFVEWAMDLGIDGFIFCNMTKYPDVDGACNVYPLFALPIESRREAKAIMDRVVQSIVGSGRRAPVVHDGMFGEEVRSDAIKDLSFQVGFESMAEGETRDCLDPWQFLLINATGDVCPCCWHPPIGNLNEQRFEEIVNGAQARELRQSLLDGHLCRECQECGRRGKVILEVLAKKVYFLPSPPVNFREEILLG